MIRDDKVDAVLFRPCDRFEASNPAIDTDRYRASVGLGLFKCRDVDAITFGKPIRNVERGLSSEQLQRLSEKYGPGRAVDIVIAPDQDLLARIDRFENSIHG